MRDKEFTGNDVWENEPFDKTLLFLKSAYSLMALKHSDAIYRNLFYQFNIFFDRHKYYQSRLRLLQLL